jgi:hypothetical protein
LDACHHDDGNVAGRILGRVGGRGQHRDDDIDSAANQISRQFGQASVLPLRGSNLDLDILPLEIAKIAERLAIRPHGFWAIDEKNANAPHPIDLLRPRDDWPRGRTSDETNKSASSHLPPEVHPRERCAC